MGLICAVLSGNARKKMYQTKVAVVSDSSKDVDDRTQAIEDLVDLARQARDQAGGGRHRGEDAPLDKARLAVQPMATTFIALLEDKDPGVRASALLALTSLYYYPVPETYGGDPNTTGGPPETSYAETFVGLLKDPDTKVQARAIFCLGTWEAKDGTVFEPFLAPDSDPDCRAFACKAIENMGKAGVPWAGLVFPLCGDTNEKVAGKACETRRYFEQECAAEMEALIKEGVPQALADMTSSDPAKVLKACGMIAGFAPSDKLDPGEKAKMVPALIARIKDPDAKIRQKALNALMRFPRDQVKPHAGKVAECLEDEYLVRLSAIEVLGRAGDTSQADKVAKFGHVENPEPEPNLTPQNKNNLCSCALRALGQMGATSKADLLAKFATERSDPACFGLARLGEAGAAAAVKRLTNTSLQATGSGSRNGAMLALQKIGDGDSSLLTKHGDVIVAYLHDKYTGDYQKKDALDTLRLLGSRGRKYEKDAERYLDNPICGERAKFCKQALGR